MDTRPPSSIPSLRSSSRLGSSTSRTDGRSTRNAFADDMLMEYIPDLEEVQEHDIQSQIADAPEYTIQQMTLQELDADLLQTKPFSSVDGVNLRKLCKFLVPERFLVEQDEVWSWEHLYTEIATEIRKSFATVPEVKKPNNKASVMETSWEGENDFRLNTVSRQSGPEIDRKFMGNAFRD